MTATIFRLPGTFNNPALPIVAPLMRSGLVAAWRLYAGEASMHDLSGNGHTLKTIGSPEWTDKGVLCSQNHHFVTDVADMLDCTIILTARPILNADGSESDGPGAGTWRRVNGEPYGVGIWNNGTATIQNINMRTTGPGSSGEIEETTNTFGGNRSKPSSGVMEYAFAAASFDSVNNTSTGRAPRYGESLYATQDWNTQSPFFTLSERPLTLPDGTPNVFVIGAAPGVSNVESQVEVCEVLIYQGALTKEQVEAQYAYSRKFYQEVFGIDV